jgi:hypothetical protein
MRVGRESTSAFRSERRYSGSIGSLQVGIVPGAVIRATYAGPFPHSQAWLDTRDGFALTVDALRHLN